MNTWRIQLSVPSGFITPWHADTLFGHICWTAERHDGFSGFKGAAGLIELYRSGTPPFILSDGFPGNWLPAPATLRTLFEPSDSGGLNRADYSTIKQAKKLEFLTQEQFRQFCCGKRFKLGADAAKPLVSSVTLHNQIDRISNTTDGEGGGLFELPEQFVSDGCISVYAHVAEGYEQDLQRLFELLAQGGYGKKRTTGKGAFTVTTFEPFNGFELPQGTTANGFVTLSHFVPAAADPIDGAWKVRVKYGKLGDEKTFCGNPFKKPLIMLQPGAVFRTANPKPWYGRLVENIAFTDPDVVQYGFAFAVPFVYR
jgi:CRISPR-associated protein Csm4